MKAKATKPAAARRKPAAKPAAAAPVESLETVIARILGEAHEPLDADAIHGDVLAAGLRPSAAKLVATLQTMCPEHVREYPGRRYWTAVAGEDSADAPVASTSVSIVPMALDGGKPRMSVGVDFGSLECITDLCERPAEREERAPSLLIPPLAPRRKLRIVTPVTPERAATLAVARDAGARELDAAVQEVRRITRHIKLVTKAIRVGQEVRTLDVVHVVDVTRAAMVTYDVGIEPPAEVKSRPLRGKEARALTMSLPFAEPT